MVEAVVDIGRDLLDMLVGVRRDEPAAVGEAVAALIADEPARVAMASRGREVVDGRGADRIAVALVELAAT